MDERFKLDYYRFRRKFFKILGSDFYIYDRHDNLVFFSKMKGLKLKEDLRVYGSEDMQEELLAITTDKILDFSAAYTVKDVQQNEVVGALKRKGIKSLARDEWVFLDLEGEEIGTLREDSLGLALVRRFASNLVPQTYELEAGGRKAAIFKQNFNPFVYKLEMDFSTDPDGQSLDRRLGIAAAVLLGGIEGKQN